MANISQTYSGDFTSFIAGKLVNAAGMAKGESDRREEKNLQKARPGSLFARALQSEFGGDLYNRTLGNFDPRKGAGETNRSTSKEGRYKAQFDDVPSKSQSDLEDAERELLKDDDSIPVKDVDAREHISKIIGVGLDVKLIQADARIQKVSNQVSSVQDTVVQTQKLLVDQTELLGAKFDTILDIFSGQLAYQQKISDEAEVRRRENELEQEKDLSTTRKIESAFKNKKKGSDILGNILGVAADMLRGRGGSAALKKILDSLKGKTANFSNALRGAARGIAQLVADDPKVTKVLKEKQYLGKALAKARLGFEKRFTKTGRAKIATAKLKNERALKLADLLGVNPTRLPDELRLGGLAALEDMYKMGFIDPKEFAETKKAAQNIMKESLLEGFPQPSKNDPLMREIMEDRKAFIERRSPQGSKTPKLPDFVNKPPSIAGKEVNKKLTSKAGAKALSQSGKTAATKGLGKAGKFVPGLGTGIAIAEAGYRFTQGDILGGIMSLGSAVPVLGWGVTAIDIARDIGFDPLNTLPENQRFERGTNLTKPGLAEVHGTEAILGKKDRSDMLSSYEQAVNQIGSILVSSSVSFADAVGMGSEVKSQLKSTGLSYDIVNIPVSTNIGRGSKSGPLSSLEDSFTRDIFARREEKEEELDKEVEDVENNSPDSPENPNSTTPISSGSASPVMIDETGEPGADFTPAGDNNRVIYDGEIVEIGHQYNPDGNGGDGRKGAGYGTYVVVRSSHPDYGQFDGLYAHFPGKNSIVVKVGDQVKRGDILGPMATAAQFGDPNMRPIVGSGNGPHTSLDFLKVGSSAKHPNWRELTRGIDPNFKTEPSKGEGGDGHRAKAFHELSKDEALSSLTPGVNDYVKPGGRSVISNTPWESITDDTLLYVYADSEGVPTIGYGSAAMRGITFGTKPITVRQAKAWLRDDINRISNGLSKNIKWWNSMTDDQRAGLIMFEYNAGEGNSYLGNPEYPTFARQLEAGNIRAAIPEIQREGPGQSRINLEQDLLRSGPQQIVGPKIVGPKIVGEGKVGAGFPFFPDLTIMKGIQDGLKRSREREQNSELLKLLPGLKNKSGDLQSSSQIMEDMEDSMIQQVYIVNTTVASTPLPPIITSSGRSNDNYVDQYRMAILGA